MNVSVGEILPDGPHAKDAIHVAIAPVFAARKLVPGTPITFVGEDQRTVDICPKPVSVGIVDPFLPRAVEMGEQFYMFINPNTITSLRHEWTHPAFNGDAAFNVKASEAWLREFCNNNDCPGYETIMEVIRNGRDEAGRYLTAHEFVCGLNEASGDIPPEFWEHAEIVLGKKLPFKPSGFSCSC